jgi:N-acetylmuramoyl-L-alanine amidase
MKIVNVGAGECLASLAKQHGFENPDLIYDHPANEVLRKNRPNMHVLQAGDKVFIPEKTSKSIPFDSSGKLKLVVKGQVTEFATVIEDDKGTPLSNMPFELEVAGETSTGMTDAQGRVTATIDASAKTGKLIIYLDKVKKNTLTWPLALGDLPPHDAAIGIQARLNNLGFYCANETGALDATTKEAITAFKTKHGLTPNAKVDDEFLSTLKQEYGF